MKCKTDSIMKIWIAAGVLGIGAFLFILYMAAAGNAYIIDDPVRGLFYSIRADWLTPFVKVITYMGNWQSITLLCIILLIMKPTRRTYGLPDDIVHLVHAGGFSFPSGHSITSMFVFGMLIYLVRTNMQNRHAANILTVVLAIPMVCIGLSRIYLGVHYPTDVLAGWSLGIVMIAVVSAVFGGSSR